MTAGAFLVTGGSSGIGAAMAGALLHSGRRVGIVSRSEPRLGHCADWLRADLADAQATAASLTAWTRAIDDAVDGLILSAVDYGIAPRHPLVASDLAEFDRLWAVNLRSQFAVLSTLLPILVARPRAVILAISSTAALEPAPGRALYAATKAGSLALLRSLAEELEDTGVSVVQALPLNQVCTAGIEARRPPGFDFKGYATPAIFEPIALHVAATLGGGMNGSVLSIDDLGAWSEIGMPPHPAAARDGAPG